MYFIDEDTYKDDCGIYKITNTQTGGVYVGQTKETFQRRFWHHRWKLTNGSHDNVHLQHSWDKYGSDSFVFSIVELNSCADINEREQFWIDFYRKNGSCYNIQDGGQPERIARYVTEEQRKYVGALNRERMLGSTLSEETKDKMSKARLDKRIYRKNDLLTDSQVIQIKRMLIEGASSRQIQDELCVPYKCINLIMSNDAYKTVHVDGWDDYRQHHYDEVVAKHARRDEIYSLLECGVSCKDIAATFHLAESTVRYYRKKLRKQTSC